MKKIDKLTVTIVNKTGRTKEELKKTLAEKVVELFLRGDIEL